MMKRSKSRAALKAPRRSLRHGHHSEPAIPHHGKEERKKAQVGDHWDPEEALRTSDAPLIPGEMEPEELFHHLDRLFLIREIMSITMKLCCATASQEDLDNLNSRKIDVKGEPCQLNAAGEPIRDLDELMRNAEEGLKTYTEFVKHFDGIPGVEIHIGPLKMRDRVQAKGDDKYDGMFARVCDIVRGKAACDDATALMAVYNILARLQTEGVVTIIKMKNRFANPTVAGYRDMIAVIKLNNPGGHEQLCELQLALEELVICTVKHDSHEEYEYFRKAFAGAWESTCRSLDEMELLHQKGMGGTLHRVMEKVAMMGQADGDLDLIQQYGRLLGDFNAWSYQLKVYMRYLTVAEEKARAANEKVSIELAKGNAIMCTVYKLLKKPELARSHAAEALKQSEQLYSEESEEYKFVTEARSNYASILHDLKEFNMAEKLMRQSWEDQKKTKGPDHWRTALIEYHLGVLYTDMRQYEKAKVLMEHAMEVKFNDCKTRENIEYLTRMFQLAKIYFHLDTVHDNVRVAEGKALEAIGLAKKVLGREAPLIFTWQQELSIILAEVNMENMVQVARSDPEILVQCITKVLKGEQLVQLLTEVEQAQSDAGPQTKKETKKDKSFFKKGKKKASAVALNIAGTVYVGPKDGYSDADMSLLHRSTFLGSEAEARREVHREVCQLLFGDVRGLLKLDTIDWYAVSGVCMGNFDESSGDVIGNNGETWATRMMGVFAIKLGSPAQIYSHAGGNTKLPERSDGEDIDAVLPDHVVKSCYDTEHGGRWTEIEALGRTKSDAQVLQILRRVADFAAHPGGDGHLDTKHVQVENLKGVMEGHLDKLRDDGAIIFAGFGGNLRLGKRVAEAQMALEDPHFSRMIEQKFEKNQAWYKKKAHRAVWDKFKTFGPGVAFVMNPATGEEHKVAVGKHSNHFTDPKLGAFMLSIEFPKAPVTREALAKYSSILEANPSTHTGRSLSTVIESPAM